VVTLRETCAAALRHHATLALLANPGTASSDRRDSRGDRLTHAVTGVTHVVTGVFAR
jgi:hypothetical protein